MKIRRALLSVYDKTGLTALARVLTGAGVEIISTGGTAKALREEGVMVSDLSAFTEFPEMMDGRVKTLHPKIHGGLLYLRGNKEHEAAARKHGIQPIDLVVVNLYPFAATIARAGVTLGEAIEQIDIGGPAMIRSAAKNHESVAVVTRPEDYGAVSAEIGATGEVSGDLRRRLAARAFAVTAGYDGQIAGYLERKAEGAGHFPETLRVELPLAQGLRYGENPHQRAALYGRFGDYFRQLQGKELSYNNILDLTAAAGLMGEFQGEKPALAIVKHNNPCGVGQAGTLREAWELAHATDRQAAFGGVIAVNGRLDAGCAGAIAEIFSEVIVATGFEAGALEILRGKKNLRLMEMLRGPADWESMEWRSVGAGSALAQERDMRRIGAGDLRMVTSRGATAGEGEAMLFGWRVAKHVKSNAIVFAGAGRTLGIGAGQMSRVDACRLAAVKAREAGLDLRGSAVASDAFFPFADGLVEAAKAGATAAIEPGGSVRDDEVIAAANERGMAMAFTGVRHFRH